MQEFNLKLSADQVNATLRVLAQGPFATVAELIATIQQQCQAQAAAQEALPQPAASPGLTD